MHRICRWRPVRSFSHSAPAHARRTIQEIRQLRKAELESVEPPTKEQVQKLLKRESERAFGPTNIGDPTAYVNKAADDVWKNILKASNNDPRVFNAWKDDIKARATANKEPLRTHPDPLGMRTSPQPPSKARQSSKGERHSFPPKP